MARSDASSKRQFAMASLIFRRSSVILAKREASSCEDTYMGFNYGALRVMLTPRKQVFLLINIVHMVIIGCLLKGSPCANSCSPLAQPGKPKTLEFHSLKCRGRQLEQLAGVLVGGHFTAASALTNFLISPHWLGTGWARTAEQSAYKWSRHD